MGAHSRDSPERNPRVLPSFHGSASDTGGRILHRVHQDRYVNERTSSLLSNLELAAVSSRGLLEEARIWKSITDQTFTIGNIIMVSQGRRDLDNVFTLKDGEWFPTLVETRSLTVSREAHPVSRQGDI